MYKSMYKPWNDPYPNTGPLFDMGVQVLSLLMVPTHSALTTLAYP